MGILIFCSILLLLKNENILQVVAAPHQDRLCLAVAKELGEKFGGWVPPP